MSGVVGGAAQGAAAGSAFGPIGTAVGAGLGAVGGYMSGRSKKKAAKARMKKMQQALKMFQAGSTDAFGNTLSADKSGRWNYDLSNATKAGVHGANQAMYNLGSYTNKTTQQLQDAAKSGYNRAFNQAANASQNAAMRNALSTGSNIGYISSAYNKNRLSNLANSLNAAKRNANATQYNANMLNALGRAATSAQTPINNMQSNLQNMVNSLNKTQMDQQNAIAGAASNPYLNGQATADLVTGIGGGLSGMGQNMQQQNNYNSLLQAIKQNPQLIKMLGM